MITVFISGGFDGLHKGHLYLLTEARKLGDRLIVATNHDEYFRHKGPNRPIDTLTTRVKKLRATGLMDEIYEIKDSPLDLILGLKPDVIVTGDDYTEDQIVGATECREWGGRVVRIKRLPGISTTEEIARRVITQHAGLFERLAQNE